MIKPNKLYSDNGAPVVNDDITIHWTQIAIRG